MSFSKLKSKADDLTQNNDEEQLDNQRREEHKETEYDPESSESWVEF